MTITSSIVFHLLSARFTLSHHPQGTENVLFHTPLLLKPGYMAFAPDQGDRTYICTDTAAAEACTGRGCVFLILGSPSPFRLPGGCDAAFAETDQPPELLLYEVCEILRKLQEWDLELKDAAADRTNLARMLCAANRPFSGHLGIVDRSYHAYDYVCDPAVPGSASAAAHLSQPDIDAAEISSLILDPSFLPSLRNTDAFLYTSDRDALLLCMNIFTKGQFLARIILTLEKEPSPGMLSLFRHACGYIRTVFLQYTDDILVKRQNDRIHGLISDLIFCPETVLPESDAEKTASSYHWRRTHTYTVLVLRIENPEKFNHISLYLCNELESEWPQSCAVRLENQIVWVINSTLCGSIFENYGKRQAFSYILRDFACRGGISNPCGDLYRLRFFYRQAVYALDTGNEKHPHFWFHRFSDYAAEYILDQIREAFENNDLYHPGIRRLVEADRRDGTHFAELLATFISCRFNATAAAGQLYKHRSTFNRQMDKVREITGIDWTREESVDQLLHLLLSLRLLAGPQT